MADIKILTEAELRSQISLDLEAVECVEQAFHALATKAVVMPPIMRLDILDNNGEIDVKTAYIPGLDSLAIKISPGFFDNPSLGLPSANGLMVLFSTRTGMVEALLLDNGYLTSRLFYSTQIYILPRGMHPHQFINKDNFHMKLKPVSLTILGLLFALSACEATPVTTDKLTTDKDKFSYGLGMMIGERVLKQYDEVDYQILLEGIKAQHQEKQTSMSLSEASQMIDEYQQKQNEKKQDSVKLKGEDFLKSNAAREGVTVTQSGLQYSVINAADGVKPAATDSVTVHYRGTLLDGTEFDSSYARGEPATFAIN
ncbi:MAG: FKBP-type peptidyl-prolyl cis-trans isomerase, partial [Proteobacteria bacterium]|nr:FKBP-type peptidyl-prolyl cis-trans isomerase [Pseudomonadota bacterium]